MKTNYFTLTLIAGCVISSQSFSQNIGINSDGTTPEASIMLDVKGTNPLTTTATQTVFQVKSFDANGLKLRMILGTNATVANTYGGLEVYDATNSAYRAFGLQPNGGNVGIGITNPTASLEIKGAGSTLLRTQPNLASQDNVLIFGAASTTINRAKIYSTGNTGDVNGDLRFSTGFAGTPVDPAMVIRSTGLVGIGTASPSWDVDVNKANASGSVIVNAQNTSAGANAGAGFLAQNDASFWAEMTIGSSTATTTTFGMANANMANYLANLTVAFGSSNNSPIIFGTNNLERMRLLNSGTLKMTGTSILSPGIWMDGKISDAAGGIDGILSRGTLSPTANNIWMTPFITNLGTVATGTFTGLTFYGADIDAGSWGKTGTGTINNGYGLYVTAPTIATTNYAGIFTGGNVGIGTASPSALLHVSYLSPSAGMYAAKIQNTGPATDPGAALILSNGYPAAQGGENYEVFGVYGNNFGSSYLSVSDDGHVGIGTLNPGSNYLLAVNGQPGANGFTMFTNYSDSRLKKNIVSIGSSLDKIMKLRPVQFNYNEEYLNLYDDPNALSRLCKGFIAQEVKEIFPEMVGSVKVKGKEYYDLNLSNLQVYMVKAMQEQQKIIEDQKIEIISLRKENQQMDKRLSAVETMLSQTSMNK